MNTERIIAIVAGALYFLGLIAGLLSVVPVIDRPDYLVQIAAHAGQVVTGAFFQFLMMAAYVGMAITLYPLLQKQNASLALGYVGFRLVAAAQPPTAGRVEHKTSSLRATVLRVQQT